MTRNETEQFLRDFFEQFFCRHDLSAAERYLHPDYIQHDYDVAPGVGGFKANFSKVFAIFPQFRVEIHHVIVDGDMAVVHAYGVTDPGKIEVLVTDIYRLQDDRLAEHWGTVQQLPPEQFGNPALM